MVWMAISGTRTATVQIPARLGIRSIERRIGMFNPMSFARPVVGSILARAKGPVQHRGIYLGDDKVFENTPEAGERIGSLAEFAQGQPVTVEKVTALSAHELHELYRRVHAAANARRRYDLITNNCDHAVTRIIEGEARSPQLVGWGLAFAAVVLVLGGLASTKA
jgi:hypothetical protein